METDACAGDKDSFPRSNYMGICFRRGQGHAEYPYATVGANCAAFCVDTTTPASFGPLVDSTKPQDILLC